MTHKHLVSGRQCWSQIKTLRIHLLKAQSKVFRLSTEIYDYLFQPTCLGLPFQAPGFYQIEAMTNCTRKRPKSQPNTSILPLMVYRC